MSKYTIASKEFKYKTSPLETEDCPNCHKTRVINGTLITDLPVCDCCHKCHPFPTDQ